MGGENCGKCEAPITFLCSEDIVGMSLTIEETDPNWSPSTPVEPHMSRVLYPHCLPNLGALPFQTPLLVPLQALSTVSEGYENFLFIYCPATGHGGLPSLYPPVFQILTS